MCPEDRLGLAPSVTVLNKMKNTCVNWDAENDTIYNKRIMRLSYSCFGGSVLNIEIDVDAVNAISVMETVANLEKCSSPR